MEIEIVGIPRSTAARLRLPRRVRTALTPARGAVGDCRIAFRDENGPKGGVDTRCTIDVRLSRRAPIHVTGRGTSSALALREALERLQRACGRPSARAATPPGAPGNTSPQRGPRARRGSARAAPSEARRHPHGRAPGAWI
jgi:hypothetical protein